MKRLFLIYNILFFTLGVVAQDYTYQTAFWKLTSFDGEFNLKGVYLDQKIKRNEFEERITRKFLTGGLFFNTTSYVWHPNFLELKLDGGYSPETGQELSLVAPDRSEVNTLKKFNASILLFQHNKMNVMAFTNLYEGFSNRESLTNLKTKTFDWGGVYAYNNKYLPFSISYIQKRNDQTELANNRSYRIGSSNILASTSKSFGFNDNHLFTISQNSYSYDDNLVPTENETAANLVENKVLSWQLKDNFFLDAKKKYRFTSSISNENQKGTYYDYQRFQLMENLTLKLPANFNFSSSYNFFNIETNTEKLKQQFVKGDLTHQLYQSVRNTAIFEYNFIRSLQYQEINQKAGSDINYVKKIPLKGLLSISYSLKSNNQNRTSANKILTIQNEEYAISDSRMVLLSNQNILLESVLVKDETGTILYTLNLDYLLIVRNELVEIQRIPGGRIADNSLVYIDYTAIQPGSYDYNAIHKSLFASVSVLDKKFEIYFRNSTQDYIAPQSISFLTLDYFTQKLYGCRINFGFFTAGVEQDNFESTIIPYRLTRYFFVLQGDIKQKLMYTLNGTVRDYQMIIQEGTTQRYYNFTGTVSYSINKNMRLNFNGAYLNQRGEGIELNLFTSRIEFSARILQLYIKAGLELYKNKFYTEKLDYKKFEIVVSRKF